MVYKKYILRLQTKKEGNKYEKQCTVGPVIRIENELYTHKPIKTNHGKAYRIGVKYYLVIGGRKDVKKICRVY